MPFASFLFAENFGALLLMLFVISDKAMNSVLLD